MIRNGAVRLQRLLAFCLTLMLLATTCFTPAYAEDIWSQLTLSILWEDGSGVTQMAPAMPVQGEWETALWVQVDPAALGQTLSVEAHGAPGTIVYFIDENGSATNQFTWTMDAASMDAAYAYPLWYEVDGVPGEVPVNLYVSSLPLKEEGEEAAPEFTPFPVAVPVYYITEEGELLDSQNVECWAGQSTPVWAASANTEGFQLAGADTVEVYVDESGTATPAEVVFTYVVIATPTPEPTEEPTPTPIPEAVIPVYYYHVNGTVLDMQEIPLGPGSHIITANSDAVEDLVPVGDTVVTVNVDAEGASDVASIMFQYDDPAPMDAVIPVYYYHVEGELLDVQELTLAEGTHVIRPDSAKVQGLTLEGASAVEVIVYADGSANVPSVQFIYNTPHKEPAQAAVTVKYIHINGSLIDSGEITLGEGTHTVQAQSGKTEGYQSVGNTSASVTVDADGNAQPAVVEFYYEDAYKAPVRAEVTVRYQTEDGRLVAQDVIGLMPGTHTIVPDEELLQDVGHVSVGEQAHLVRVDETGGIDPASVVFICRNVSVKITVHYQDDRGRDLAPEQEVVLNQDGEFVVKAQPENLPANYELAPGQSSEIRVMVTGGVPNKPEIYFYYQQRQSSPSVAHVTVCYYDPYGNEIAPAQEITLKPGVHQVTADSAETFRGYVLVSEPSITVEVYENGTFSPQEVAFYYRFADEPEQQQTAAVTVMFKDDRGNEVAPAQTHELPDGEHLIQAPAIDGYQVFDGTDKMVTIAVSGGVASRSQVVFYYQKAQSAPSVFTIPVNYYDTMGEKVAATQYVQVGAGTYAVQANPADLPDGYELMMDPVLTVKVNRDGTTEPEEIAFYYRPPEKTATIIVAYADENGRYLIDPYTVELKAGYHDIRVDARRVPNGYDPDSAEAMRVYVSREGIAEPEQVIFTLEKLVMETPIPVGAPVYRYAKVTSNSVAFRKEPSTSGGNKTVIKRLSRSDEVFVLEELYNDKGETWAMVNVDGRIGYMMSDFIDVMSQAESDAYAGMSTPVPTFTPEPTEIPTATPTLEPLPTPTYTPPLVEALTPPPAIVPPEEITPTPTAVPTATPTEAPTATPAPYQGYALTTRTTALRTGISASDMTIMHDMEANTLVHVANQILDMTTGEMWSIISTLNGQAGFVHDSALRYITEREAQPYLELWEEINREPAPTKLVTATPEPMQLEGYGVVLGDGVPFRQMQSEFSRIIDNLEAGTMVYISGQTAGEGQYWHSVNYQGRWGYIRADLVRMLTVKEEEEYIESLRATPAPVTTNIPFDADGLSSYGYVDGSSVNWRKGPSTGDAKVGELRRYAFCLVLGSEYVNGVTWYKVKYGEDTGYIHGDFFRQMTISELEDFLGSEEYLQGVVNNSPEGSDALNNVGFTGTGGLVSAEDQWVHDNNNLVMNTVSPWKPIATVAPILTTPTLEPLPGVTPTPYITPSPTPTFNQLPDVTYPTSSTGNGGSAVIWVFVLGLLLLAVGGVFALVRHQQNKRRIAMRAAQRRAQAARAQQQQQRPYARTAAPGQPRTGMYPNQQTQVRRPAQEDASQGAASYQTYARPAYQQERYFQQEKPTQVNPPVTPNTEAATQRNPRVSRRTAYRQSQENQQDNFDE